MYMYYVFPQLTFKGCTALHSKVGGWKVSCDSHSVRKWVFLTFIIKLAMHIIAISTMDLLSTVLKPFLN